MGYPAGTTLEIELAGIDLGQSRDGTSTSIVGFNIYLLPPEVFGEAWATLLPLLAEGLVKPAVAQSSRWNRQRTARAT